MTCRLPDLVSASDWLCRVGKLLPPIRSTIQIWVYSMEFLRLFLRGNFALKPMLVSRNVGCFLRHSCWPRERKRSIWIRNCNLNVLVCFVFFSFYFALLLRTDDEGSEETMDTESQQKSTLSNDVYKQASLDFLSLVVFSHSIYRKPREDAITNYVI